MNNAVMKWLDGSNSLYLQGCKEFTEQDQQDQADSLIYRRNEPRGYLFSRFPSVSSLILIRWNLLIWKVGKIKLWTSARGVTETLD